MACSPQDLMRAANCDIAVFNNVMAEAAELVLLCAIRDGTKSMACDPQTIIAQSQCLISCIPEGGYGAAKVAILCQILENGTGGGSGLGGTVTIANNVQTGTVVFATPLAAAPTAVITSIQSPANGFIMYAILDGPPTAIGFSYQLSGITDSANYVLHYSVIP